MPDRDIRKVRIVGGLVFGLGLLLIVLTFFIALFGLFSGSVSDPNQLIPGLLGLGLSLVMACSLIACGAELQKIRPYSSAGIESMRLVWTSLVILMFLGGIAGFWLAPPLSSLALIVLIALFLVRGAVVRLTR